MRGLRQGAFVPNAKRALVRSGWILLALTASVFSGGEVQRVHAAGFFVTPLVVQAGQPFTFDIALAGHQEPGLPAAEGSELLFQIRVNVDRGSLTPGVCVATKQLNGGWGQDWLITGPDATWTYPNVTAECNGTNGLGPGDYIAEIDYYRANADGSAILLCTGISGAACSNAPPHQARITVLSPISATVTSDNFVTGGALQVNIDIAGDGAAGTWSASIQSVGIVGPCSGTLTLPDWETSWGVDRVVNFPSSELVGTCGNLGMPGAYSAQVLYRNRLPSGVLSVGKGLVTSFSIRPMLFTMFPPLTAAQQAEIGVYDIIAAGDYGEKITSLSVTCPDGSVDQILAERLQTMNDALGASNPGYSRLWPSASFEGPCDLLANGTYTVALSTVHQSYSSAFAFINPDDTTDTDGDGITDVSDNCDGHANPEQDDFDQDQQGNECDDDDDGDGVPDASDNCPRFISPSGHASPNQNNLDGDSMGDICDPDDDGDDINDADEMAAGTDPLTPTTYNPGINPYSGGQPAGTSNPATAGETVGVVVSAPDNVDSVAVTVTDPNGGTAFDETLTPQSPVVFSFVPNRVGEWTIRAELSAAGSAVGTLSHSLQVVDSAPATVTINQHTSQGDPTGAVPIVFTVVFSEPVSGFTAADVAFSGSTTPGALLATVSGAGATYTVSVTGMTGSGTLEVSLLAGAAQALADGGTTLASTSTDNSVSYVIPAVVPIPVVTAVAPTSTATSPPPVIAQAIPTATPPAPTATSSALPIPAASSSATATRSPTPATASSSSTPNAPGEAPATPATSTTTRSSSTPLAPATGDGSGGATTGRGVPALSLLAILVMTVAAGIAATRRACTGS